MRKLPGGGAWTRAIYKETNTTQSLACLRGSLGTQFQPGWSWYSGWSRDEIQSFRHPEFFKSFNQVQLHEQLNEVQTVYWNREAGHESPQAGSHESELFARKNLWRDVNMCRGRWPCCAQNLPSSVYLLSLPALMLSFSSLLSIFILNMRCMAARPERATARLQIASIETALHKSLSHFR